MPPKLTASAPVFLVRDIVAAANHYRDALGFAYERFHGEPPAFVILHRDGMYLMLAQAGEPAHVVPHWTLSPKLCQAYFWVSDADALHAEFARRGAQIDYGPCDQPYGCREFGIRDLDGYDVAFGQVVGREESAPVEAKAKAARPVLPRATGLEARFEAELAEAVPDWVSHNVPGRRFELAKDGRLAVAEYRMEGGRMILTHTFVPPEWRGRGIAARLVAAAMEHARTGGLKVVPECSYAEAFLRRNPQYAGLRAE